MAWRASAVAGLLLSLAVAPPSAAQQPDAAAGPHPYPTPAALPPRAVGRLLPQGPMIRRAYAADTRDSTGRPGAHYWQQSVDYRIAATLDVGTAVLHGTEHVVLHNSSPDTLDDVVVRLFQNYFTAEVSRNDYVTDITDGMVVDQLAVNGKPVTLSDSHAWSVRGTIATLTPSSPIPPGADVALDITWHFTVPNVAIGARGERMGRWGHELYQVAQWYPQIAMYDDLRGWDRDPYLGIGEFYNQFGSFDVSLTVPAGWLVGATGVLRNPDEVLAPGTRARLEQALRQDSTVHVVTADQRGPGSATAGTAGTPLTWHFTADTANDFAFATSKDYVLDATHALAPDTVLVQVLYWPEHGSYRKGAQIARFGLEHHAAYVMPYAFSRATVADGPETGMEYPMIIFSSADFGTEVHELGHEWFPMMVGSNETWYGWQDEGFNDWIDQAAGEDFSHQPLDTMANGEDYRQVAGSEVEPAMMWPSDYAGPLYTLQAYEKAPLALYALGGVVGDSAVHTAFAGYARAWRFKHPTPWDFFQFVDHSVGKDLGWFWNAWWFTTETFDQGIDSVRVAGNAVDLRVVDHSDMAMPIVLRVEFTDGTTALIRRPESVWFAGARAIPIHIALGRKKLRRLVLDPENRFQDLNRTDNVWPATPRGSR